MGETMRDRLAVALYENAYPPEIRSGYEWDMVPGYWHEQADAALAVMREPDEAMLRAVNSGWPYPDPTPVWQAMIDAASKAPA